MHPTFGRYELLRRLAGGGMGEVYLARQRGIDGFEKLLVLKTLLPHLCQDEEFITMFKDEARVTAQLVHPNIGQVFEFEQVNGVYYMAMEYLHGEDLRRLWRAGEREGRPLRAPLICRIVADAAAGLDFAHSLRDGSGQPYGIVHRDVSPQNILVTFEGGVKVIDFGVAKAAGRAQHTRTGALKGKYGYMSPEQVAGGALDNRSDIFALGVVLHELLTGARLFKADSDMQTLWRVRECRVRPPSEVNGQVPASLDPLVLKALSKDPDLRYRSAQEFRLALEEWLIHGRMNASSAHLAEFLKQLYAERLALEAMHGPLLGEPPFAGPAPGVTPPSSPITGGPPLTRTLDQSEDRGSSALLTRPGEPGFRRRSRMGLTAGVTAAGAAAAAAILFRAPARPNAGISSSSVVSTAAQPPSKKPATHAVTLDVAPAGTEIYEGDRLIGTSPRLWADAEEGEHELRFRREGYLAEKAIVRVAKDGDQFHFRLRRRPPLRPRALGIKAER